MGIAPVTNISDYKKKDLSQYKDGNYDVDEKFNCIIKDGEKAYDLISKIQKDKERKGINRRW